MFANKYAGICDKCGIEIEVGNGFAIKLWGKNAQRVKMNDGSFRYKRCGKDHRNPDGTKSGMKVVWHVRCAACME